MLVQGPLALDWGNRKWGILPGLENAALTVGNPPTVRRLRLWVRQHIAVEGQPDWAFVKVHTHGMSATGLGLFQDGTMARIFRSMQETCGGGEGWRIHYASAREMFNIIRAAEDGRKGTPGDYRDYAVGPPPCLRRNPGG